MNVELARKVKESGLKKKYIAAQMGITAYALQMKIDGITEFKASEIKNLSNILGITDPKDIDTIFFN